MNNSVKKGILIAFGEMFLKSKSVKDIFQKKLLANLCFSLRKENIDFKSISFRDRLFIATEDKKSLKLIKNVFGVSWFSECSYFPQKNLDDLFIFIKENWKEWIKENETYAIRIRVNKEAIKEDREFVIKKIAESISRKVDLTNPKKEIFIEIRKQGFFLFLKKRKGLGGLPVSTGGRALVLMSGGIDSPVAAYLGLKRGLENVWVHFHSFPLTSDASISKIEELAKVFLKYQRKLKVYFIPFSKAQMEIKAKCLPEYRVLLYRRLMLRIAEEILKSERIEGIITGESLGQVSSQTLPNINIIEEATKIPILRPLIAMDKEEIIRVAESIGTFKTSILPQEDCCTLFVSKHQTAKGDIKRVKELEKKINIKKMIRESMNSLKIEEY